ncbi:hypothetical protein [Nocardia cyriacigeorgica]|uniref:hypothetical protein n=1 Tax=Nocardia cyriacigeorgica TaxID=135487 RepID=UPI0018952FC0|nr:hypothetical protein [Nocardia cyriacigeorgica]MBF6286232.1 hypothetical protein [Nocardia cyriacigeorgica]
MAKRFTDAEKARAVKKVEKLRAEGKSLNAACEEVVQKVGWPSVGALTNWVKAAASANGAAAAEEPAPAEAAPAPRKRVVKKAPKARAATARKRAASTNGSSPAKKAAARLQAAPAAAATLVAEPEPTPVVEELTAVAEAPATEQPAPAAEQPAPATEQRAAELVAVTAPPASTVTPVADPEFGHRSADDLANEVRRLRIALEELHGENRALKDLVGIYVRR